MADPTSINGQVTDQVALSLSLHAHYSADIIDAISRQAGDPGQLEFDDLSQAGQAPSAELETILQQRHYPTPQHLLAEVRRNLFTDIAFVEKTSLLAVSGELQHRQFAATNFCCGAIAETVINLGLLALLRRPLKGAVSELGLTVVALGAVAFFVVKYLMKGDPVAITLTGLGLRRSEVASIRMTPEFFSKKGEEQLNASLSPALKEEIEGIEESSDPVTFKDLERYEVEAGRSGVFKVKKGRRTFVTQERGKELEDLTTIAASRLATLLNNLFRLFARSSVVARPTGESRYALRLQEDLEQDGVHSLRTYGFLTIGSFMLLRGIAGGLKWFRGRDTLGPRAGWLIGAQCLIGLIGAGVGVACASRYNRERKATDPKVIVSPTQLWGVQV